MSDYRDNWKDAREREQAYRATLVPCYQCGTKNAPEDANCFNCGAPNSGHQPKSK